MTQNMNKTLFLRMRNKYNTFVTEANLEFAVNYKPANDDLFLVSYPKAGSNWTYLIIKMIANNGVCDVIDDTSRKHFNILEYKGVNTVRKPMIATELPYELLPKNPLAKYVFVFRNPKDTVVSFYYHRIVRKDFGVEMDFHQYVREWIAGEDMDYFQLVADYWRHRMDGNYLYLVYEQMKRNPKEAVLKIAEFLGKEFADKLLANNELLLNEVLQKSSFDYVKSNNSLRQMWKPFVRKGTVADWRSHLTRDESDLIDAKFTQYFAGTELEAIWKEDMKWE